MKIELLYLGFQLAAVGLMLAWIFAAKKKVAGSVLRGFALFASIVSLMLLNLCGFDKVPLLVWIYYGVTGFVFLVYAIDKAIATSNGKKEQKDKSSRFSENMLLVLAVISIVGAVSGMLVCNHKRKKAKFQTMVPVIAFAECVVYYFFLLKGKELVQPDLTGLHYFPVLTVVTSAMLCIVLVRTFILLRLLVIIPVSLLTALYSVGFFFNMEHSVSVTSFMDMIKAKPIPFIAVAALVFIILEVISVRSRFFTSGNEVRKKTDHSADK